MQFEKVIGQHHLKAFLSKTVENGRIPHAQLFVGSPGAGILPLAIAYARLLLCETHEFGSPQRELCGQKVDKLAHPDLHFVYPVNKNDDVKKHPVSTNFIEQWRQFVGENPYGSLYEWLSRLGIENKQGIITVDEAHEILKNLSLKSYEGGFKVMIIWMADKMNTACSNKILKIVEEPPDKTVLLLLTNDEEQLLKTIRSRCQVLNLPLLAEEDVSSQLIDLQGVEPNLARKIARRSNGDFNRALHILQHDANDIIFESWFIEWVRLSFKVKRNKTVINDLFRWSEMIAGQGRETQKQFISFCTEVFRQAMLKNYKADELLFFEAEDNSFNIEKFAPFIHQNNIYEIMKELEAASYHVERNGNAKIIFSDLSIKLTRLIHRKELA